MRRREFLITSGRAALGLSALSISACSPRTRNAEPKDVFLESLVTSWEAGIPRWLHETKMPAVSIAIIRDGELAWRRAFWGQGHGHQRTGGHQHGICCVLRA